MPRAPLPRKKHHPARALLVFVSHAGTDTWVAGRIAEKIKSLGGQVVLDETEIAVGEDFEERILHALDRADELLVLLTPWALNRPYVWSEIGAAWGRRKPIIGILHGLKPDELISQAGVPVLIKRRNLIELNDIDSYFAQLQKRVSAKRRKRGR